ncbi:MAG TPA: ATP-binding protein [Hanamia sp.]|nr:ATP-binding protein [Hanamia sp.]
MFYFFKLIEITNSVIGYRDIRISYILISPLWETWWAYALYLAAIAGLIFLFFLYRLNRIRAKHQLEIIQKEAGHLKAVDEMKSRFFSNITHEFRTPLSLIISPLEQVLQDKELTPELSKKLSIVERNAQHLLRLINQLLDMSKLESGNMKLALFRGELNSFVEEIVQSFSQTAETRHIKLTVDTNNAEGTYLFDTEKWEKILFNLVSNALKFTPEKGEVKVKLFASEKDKDNFLMHLEVSDTGIGIPEAKIPFIFHRFYQADETGTRKYEGTGIGLSIVKELIELMKGSIEAESKPGEGTVFRVSVSVKKATGNTDTELEQPLIVHEQETDPLMVKALKVSILRNDNLPLILVVEDNAELCEFISRSLGKNYRSLTAANGAEGLKIAIEENPDVIVSDVMMPEMDGYALCKKIKSNVQTDHIAVILLTAKASHHSVMEGLIAGADGYLTKPFHTDELLLRIHNLLLWQEKIRLLFQAQLSNPEIGLEPKEIQHEFITNLYKILDEHLDDNTLNVAKLSSLMTVSHRTLNRKLTSLIGLSASEVIKQYRLKKSIEFLKAGSNVSETAYSVGFETHSHFSTSFKSFFGVTPTSYMQTKGDK